MAEPWNPAVQNDEPGIDWDFAAAALGPDNFFDPFAPDSAPWDAFVNFDLTSTPDDTQFLGYMLGDGEEGDPTTGIAGAVTAAAAAAAAAPSTDASLNPPPIPLHPTFINATKAEPANPPPPPPRSNPLPGVRARFHEDTRRWQCAHPNGCSTTFSRRGNLLRHWREIHCIWYQTAWGWCRRQRVRRRRRRQ
ncbi:hypothetical protein SLS57_011887 [Botryosphaeria dothidea]